MRVLVPMMASSEILHLPLWIAATAIILLLFVVAMAWHVKAYYWVRRMVQRRRGNYCFHRVPVFHSDNIMEDTWVDSQGSIFDKSGLMIVPSVTQSKKVDEA